MKKVSILIASTALYFNCIFAQTQISLKAGSQTFGLSERIFQIGIPADIRLNDKFVVSSGLMFSTNKEAHSFNPKITKTTFSGSASSFLFTGYYRSEHYMAKDYKQNYLAIPLAIKYRKDRKWAFIAEAGLNAAYAVSGKVATYETQAVFKKEEPTNTENFGNSHEANAVFEKINYDLEGLNRFSLEYRLGFGVKMPRNIELTLHWEKTISDLNIKNTNGFKNAKNSNAYLTLSVPIKSF